MSSRVMVLHLGSFPRPAAAGSCPFSCNVFRKPRYVCIESMFSRANDVISPAVVKKQRGERDSTLLDSDLLAPRDRI